MSVWCCLGSGPSLTRAEVELLRGRVRVLCINDTYRMAPWADAVYAADMAWWAIHWQFVRQDFAGRMYTIKDNQDAKNPYIAHQLYDCQVFEQGGQDGFETDPRKLALGSLSGYQGINVVKHWGATVCGLLGYDMRMIAGKRHWFGDHPSVKVPANTAKLRNTEPGQHIAKFATMHPEQHGLQVVNLSAQSALTCFPKMTVQEFLAKYA